MKKFPAFFETLCAVWQLPCPVVASEKQKPCISINIPGTVPRLLDNPREKSWASCSRRLWIQTDNQEIERAFSGQSYIKGSFLRPLCVRIARALLRIAEAHFLPRTDISSFVEWDPRELNTLADDAAIVALNMNSD
jgi:hypothetical protein